MNWSKTWLFVRLLSMCFLPSSWGLQQQRHPSRRLREVGFSLPKLEAFTVNVACRMKKVEVAFSQNGEKPDGPSNDEAIFQPGEEGGDSSWFDESSMYVCILRHDDMGTDFAYDIDLPKAVVRQLDQATDDGKASLLSLQEAIRDDNSARIVITADTITSLTHVEAEIESDGTISDLGDGSGADGSSRRLLASTATGVNTVLVLRVSYLSTEPTLSSVEIAGRIFGRSGKAVSVNMSSQYKACSHDKLRFVPSRQPGTRFGVANINITEQVTGVNSVRTLENRVISQATELYGDIFQDNDHVMIHVPPDSSLRLGNRTFLAYAQVHGQTSVFSDLWGGSVSVLVHEMGHNLGLSHSGALLGNREHPYGDISGSMGFAVGDVGGPRSCFNAQKHWLLGWFQDRAISLRVQDLPWGGHVAAFVDYGQTKAGEFVLINIGRTGPKLYLQYNVAKGANIGTRAHGDAVVIVRDDSEQHRQSWLVEALDEYHPILRYDDFDNQGNDLVIELCALRSGPPDLARLSIHLDDGIQTSTCFGGSLSWNWSNPHCDDNATATFFVDEKRGNKTCGWLNRNLQRWKDTLCVPGQFISDTCPETCQKCFDNCQDTPGRQFLIHDRLNQTKDCEWLSSRPSWQKRLCVQNKSEAFDLCRESCNTCVGVDRR